jgi:hypothetical protein
MTMKSSSGGGHVIGVPVTSKAHGIEEVSRDPSFSKGAGDHLAVSLTHPSPYASFGYKHSESLVPYASYMRLITSEFTACLLTCFCSDAAGSKGQVTHWVSKLSRRAQGFREHGESSLVSTPSVITSSFVHYPKDR